MRGEPVRDGQVDVSTDRLVGDRKVVIGIAGRHLADAGKSVADQRDAGQVTRGHDTIDAGIVRRLPVLVRPGRRGAEHQGRADQRKAKWLQPEIDWPRGTSDDRGRAGRKQPCGWDANHGRASLGEWTSAKLVRERRKPA